MFQCPNCRAYTDLSAEVDVDDSNDSNDVDTGKGNDDMQEPPQTSSGSQEPSAESGPAAAPTQEQERTESNPQTSDAPFEEGLADNIENMRLQDDSPSEAEAGEAQAERTPNMSSGSPEPAVGNITSAPTTGSDASFIPSQPVAIRRSDTPFRSESSDDNPLTPRNDSGPLAFDGRAGMP